ncbi:MAG: Kelch repeat-containing protein [Candidatus Odinarchaeota archaeon]
MKRIGVSNKLILLVLVLSLIYSFGLVLNSTVEPSRATAIKLSTSNPTGRFGHSMVFDESNQQLILFGGSAANDGRSDLSDTWVFNCTSNKWIKLNPTSKPSGRMEHSMVYDSVNQQVILFGGWSDETWLFNPQSQQWTEVTSASAIHPSARHSAGMYFDPVNEKAVLFGGFLENEDSAADMWIFDPADNTWTEVTPSSKPAGRYGHSMVYDSVNQRGLLFGGRVTGLQSDTWAYDYSTNSWSSLYTASKPVKRYWHDAVFDSNKETMVIFGGDDEGPGRSRNDIWTFNVQDDQWTELSPENKPIPRMSPAMAYDSLNQRIILFGGLGNDYSDSYNDLWAYDSINSNWTSLVETDNPGASLNPGFGLSLIFTGLMAIVSIKRWKGRKRS